MDVLMTSLYDINSMTSQYEVKFPSLRHCPNRLPESQQRDGENAPPIAISVRNCGQMISNPDHGREWLARG